MSIQCYEAQSCLKFKPFPDVVPVFADLSLPVGVSDLMIHAGNAQVVMRCATMPHCWVQCFSVLRPEQLAICSSLFGVVFTSSPDGDACGKTEFFTGVIACSVQ